MTMLGMLMLGYIIGIVIDRVMLELRHRRRKP